MLKNSRVLLILLVSFFIAMSAKSDEVDAILKRGYISCGVTIGINGISMYDKATKEYSGFEVDLCKGLAIALFNDSKKVKFITINLDTRFSDLEAKKYDVLLGSHTLNFRRSVLKGIQPTVTIIYDNQPIVIRQRFDFSNLKTMAKANLEPLVCYLKETNNEPNFNKYLKTQNIELNFKKRSFSHQEFLSKDLSYCDLLVNDGILIMSYMANNPSLKTMKYLEDEVSFDALTMFIKIDKRLRKIVETVFAAIVIAEDKGINLKNIDDIRKNTNDYEVKALLGIEKGLGASIGVSDDFAYNVIKVVGNYGEIFERNLGVNSIYKLKRGRNNTIKNGGLIYAPPVGKW